MLWRRLHGHSLTIIHHPICAQTSIISRAAIGRRASTRGGEDSRPEGSHPEGGLTWDSSWLEQGAGRHRARKPPRGLGISLDPSPETPVDRGVSIDKRGQLRVTSRTNAQKNYQTALILSAASTNLTRDDFLRLLPGLDEERGYGFEAAIPGRHIKSLERLPYWILLFKSPYLAASYQGRLQWYHQNAVDNLPVTPLQAASTPGRRLTPPPGYVDPQSGEDVWKGLREYSILHPAQDFTVTALLPEFPPSVVQAIQRYQKWNDSPAFRSWTVRMRVYGQQLSKDRVCRFLEEDGQAQNRPWGIVNQQCSATPTDGEAERAVYAGVVEETDAGGGSREVQNFLLRFRSEGEAMRFWRMWHRKPFPSLAHDGVMAGVNAPLLHLEITW